ncbi:unnamed protein product [Clonostachys rosea]|uniref:Fungal-specific transcription factor domain-containing protein n=1 Tax=Bionectria ochroleuca TaxID=29856 RepID=A0ABY6U1S2_BIOOC|nr:unnamed protein product [Clonostachys rosea]
MLNTKEGTETPVSATIVPALDQVPLSLPLIPQQSHQLSELLSYYLSRTANSMGNGSTAVNPFISKLIPLAFDNPFIMQLILAQSAAHREEELQDYSAQAVAQQYYTKSLRLFSQEIDAHFGESRGGTLLLAFGSLIMSLTEIARGEIHGFVFDHLGAAAFLVSKSVSDAQHDTNNSLFDFLVEYYIHMTATSMLSMDVQYGSQPFFKPSIRQAAETLVTKNYIGQLCGAWLEILLLIPRIFQLGQRMRKKPVHPETLITFGCYQSQIQAFLPSLSASASAITAGLVFKQAGLLYLWTILSNPLKPSADDTFSDLIRGAVNTAFTQLGHLSATERVNTSLCWPITIIGCCTADPAIRSQLRERLHIMSRTIGLGNMKRTVALLECVWKGESEDISPWTLYKSMQEHQIWISLA